MVAQGNSNTGYVDLHLAKQIDKALLHIYNQHPQLLKINAAKNYCILLKIPQDKRQEVVEKLNNFNFVDIKYWNRVNWYSATCPEHVDIRSLMHILNQKEPEPPCLSDNIPTDIILLKKNNHWEFTFAENYGDLMAGALYSFYHHILYNPETERINEYRTSERGDSHYKNNPS